MGRPGRCRLRRAAVASMAGHTDDDAVMAPCTSAQATPTLSCSSSSCRWGDLRSNSTTKWGDTARGTEQYRHCSLVRDSDRFMSTDFVEGAFKEAVNDKII
jgi:hypothetical protein